MNKIVSLFLLMAIALVGCENTGVDGDDDFIIWDFWCHSVAMKVTNAAGENLLKTETEGNILNQRPYVVHKNEIYDLLLHEPGYQTETRALPPSFRELYLAKGQDGEVYLCFGEFSPQSNYHGEPFTIYWGDGSRDEVGFDLYITWKTKRDPDVHMGITVNGKRISDDSLFIEFIK